MASDSDDDAPLAARLGDTASAAMPSTKPDPASQVQAASRLEVLYVLRAGCLDVSTASLAALLVLASLTYISAGSSSPRRARPSEQPPAA